MPSDGTKYGTGDAEVDSRGVPVVKKPITACLHLNVQILWLIHDEHGLELHLKCDDCGGVGGLVDADVDWRVDD